MSTALRSLIPESEYADRLMRLREAMAEKNFDVTIVWGRGGGTVDRAADVRYLTGFYPVFPTIRDVPGLWSDRGLSALLITPTEVLLFSDDADADEAAFGITASIARTDVSNRTLVGDMIVALRERTNATNIVIASSDAMSGKQARAFLKDNYVSRLAMDWDDSFIENLRLQKSPNEVTLMRTAAGIAEAALEAGFTKSAPGVPEAEVVAAMVYEVEKHEAAFANAFVYTTTADGEMIDNRLPTHGGRPLAKGDLFTIDITGTFAGYYFDLARSWVIGTAPTTAQNRAYQVAKQTVDVIVGGLHPGVILGDASKRGSGVLSAAGIDPDSGEFPARGHGLGLAFERPWVRDSSDLVLEPGMVISIEQFVTIDGISATFERNILISGDGPKDLVAVRDFWTASKEQETK